MCSLFDIVNDYGLKEELETLVDYDAQKKLKHVFDNFGSYFLKKEDYEIFVDLVSRVNGENFKNLIPKMIDDFGLYEPLEKWKNENPSYKEWDYRDQIGFLIWRTITKRKLLKGKDLGLDNYEIITNNVCAILHYLFAHYSDSFTFEQIFILACTIDLFFHFEDELSLNDIVQSLYTLFAENEILIDEESFQLDEQFLNTIDFSFILSKVCMACLSITFRINLPELLCDEIVDSIMMKKEDISNQVKCIFEEPYYFIDYEIMRFIVDDFMEKNLEIVKQIKNNKIHFFDDSSLFGIVNYQITDFADDFDLDGFGLKSAIKLYNDLGEKIDSTSDKYILELEYNKNNMARIIKDICPKISISIINDMKSGAGDEQFIAGICFLYGICVKQNFKEAYECFLNSSQKYNSEAFLQLSTMYLKSIYVSFDVTNWLLNLNKACRLGNEMAIEEWNSIKRPDSTIKIKFSGIGRMLYARYKDSIKIKYISLTNKYLSQFIEYPKLYEEECNSIFTDVDYFDYQLEVLYYLKEINNKQSIDFGLASEIAALFEKLGRGHFNHRNIVSFNGDIRFNPYGLEDKLYVSICWKKYANSIRGDRDEIEIPQYNENGIIKKYPFESSTVKTNNSSSGNGGCYIATCVYGSYDCPQVWTLRRYRDDKLSKTWQGRLFIKTYYAISPTLVKWFGKTSWFKKMWRGILDNMAKKCKEEGFLDTPYSDKEW